MTYYIKKVKLQLGKLALYIKNCMFATDYPMSATSLRYELEDVDDRMEEITRELIALACYTGDTIKSEYDGEDEHITTHALRKIPELLDEYRALSSKGFLLDQAIVRPEDVEDEEGRPL